MFLSLKFQSVPVWWLCCSSVNFLMWIFLFWTWNYGVDHEQEQFHGVGVSLYLWQYCEKKIRAGRVAPEARSPFKKLTILNIRLKLISDEAYEVEWSAIQMSHFGNKIPPEAIPRPRTIHASGAFRSWSKMHSTYRKANPTSIPKIL